MFFPTAISLGVISGIFLFVFLCATLAWRVTPLESHEEQQDEQQPGTDTEADDFEYWMSNKYELGGSD